MPFSLSLVFFTISPVFHAHRQLDCYIYITAGLLDYRGGWCEKTRRYLQLNPAISQDFPAFSQYFPWFPAIKKKRPAELVSTAALSQGFNGPVQ
jgi:hypothetical protein